MFRFPGRALGLAIFIAALVLAGCQQRHGENVVQGETVNETSPLPRLPVAEPPMDRAALLLAAARAVSATGLARDDSEEQRHLDGKAFELRIRFGCMPADPQPQTSRDAFVVRYDARARTLRVRAAPDLTLDDPETEALAGEAIEAVEGFWVSRPWLLADGCPAAPAPKPAAPLSKRASASQDDTAARSPSAAPGRRIGIAQFFTETDSRTGRREKRGYETMKLLGEDEEPSSQGYNLVLSGRLRKLASGRVIACQAQSRDLEPDCIVSVEFDRVWIEDPETRQIVAEWGN
jgi:hypothetical protein